jgi:endoglucanase
MSHFECRSWRGACRALSVLSVALPTLLFAAKPAFPQYVGYWHTSGRQILDSGSPAKTVRIGGVNWYGFETTDGVVHGLTSQDYKTILSTVKNLGYNTVRLPYANQIVEKPIIPGNISYNGQAGPINTDLKGLNSLQIMDKIIAEAGKLGLKVILDDHRSESGNSAEASGLWYTSAYPETSWIADWKTLVARYASYTDSSGNPTLIGVDLRNEPHNATSGGSCWTGDSSVGGCPASDTLHNWPAAAGRAAAAVLAVNSKLLIFVEGVDCYDGDCDFWGGNLEGAKNNPVPMTVSQRLVASAHDYGPTEYQQSWFNSSTTPQSLEAVWTKYWAYLSIDGLAPVWVGEFGTTNDAASAESSVPGSEGQWFSSLVAFLANQPNIDWTYWALNGEDNYGLLDSNYDATPPSSLKQQLLSSIQAGAVVKTPPSCATGPGIPGGLAAKADSSSAISLAWTAVAPPANCSVTYSVYRGTTSGFAVSSSSRIASGAIAISYTDNALAASTTYYYAIEAVDAEGSSAASAKVSATTAKPSAVSCKIGYSILNDWGTGFQTSLTIANTGSADLTSWTLKFAFPGNQQVTSMWNANYTESGEALTLTNEAYNGTIAPGTSYTAVGFTGSYSGSNAKPTSFTLNGVACGTL